MQTTEMIIKSLTDKDLIKDYQNALLNDRLNNNSISIIRCPKCNWYINLNNVICSKIARCGQCFWPVCVKCQHESHWPLDCEQAQEFYTTRHSQMQQLHSAQKKLERREEKLKDLRVNQKEEIQKVLDETVTDFINLNNSEIKEIENMKLAIEGRIAQWMIDIEDDKKKLKEMVEEQQGIDTFHPVLDHILQLIENIEKEKGQSGPHNYDIAKKQEQLNSKIESIKSDNDILINGCSSALNYAASLHKFEQSQNHHAYLMVNIKDDTELAELLSIPIKCPTYGQNPNVIEGVNQMNCVCGENVCLLCGQLCDENHSIHEACPKYMTKYEDDPNAKDDAEDNKFYKQPMSIDKRASFMSYNNFYAVHMKNMEIYNEMISEYNRRDEPFRCELLDRCPFVRLRRTFEKEMMQEKAINLTLKVLNTALLGQSIIAWGYLQIYILNENLDYSNANKFEIKLLKMRKTLLTLLDMIRNPTKCDKTEVEFETSISNLVDDIIKIAE